LELPPRFPAVEDAMPTPSADARPGATPKMECFETLRGLAAFAVLVGHVVLGFWPGAYFRSGPLFQPMPFWVQGLARFPGKYFWNGELAVTIFFVLSGFVLSLTYFQGGSTSGLGRAAARRYPRLMLPIMASVLLAYLLLQGGAMYNQAAVRLMNQSQGLTLDLKAPPGHSNKWLAAYYDFAPDFASALREGTWGAFTTVANYNLVLWTMPIELTGSFLVYGFLALFGCLRNRWLLYALAGSLLLAQGHYYLVDFLLGMILCDVWVRNQQTGRKSLSPTPALGLIALGVFVMPWKYLAAVLVVGATAAAPRVQQLLSGPCLAFLGRVSFGLYLVHMPIFCSLGCGLYVYLCQGLGWSHAAGSVVGAVASLLGSLLTAWVFYLGVDRPTIALTRRLDAWLFRPEKGTLGEDRQTLRINEGRELERRRAV
jgi:peptidoglycan/LPS O-acetylase OafA/YrhL